MSRRHMHEHNTLDNRQVARQSHDTATNTYPVVKRVGRNRDQHSLRKIIRGRQRTKHINLLVMHTYIYIPGHARA